MSLPSPKFLFFFLLETLVPFSPSSIAGVFASCKAAASQVPQSSSPSNELHSSLRLPPPAQIDSSLYHEASACSLLLQPTKNEVLALQFVFIIISCCSSSGGNWNWQLESDYFPKNMDPSSLLYGFLIC
ncbi:unnamed protein product [Linum trigynum]|uniref:Uncharacterized protein n=1 Tax=Linum trigynum TaxID=586398 RepID=A0AAV2DZP2_9ROSI